MRMQDAIIKRITELCAENEITFYQLSIISAVPPSTLKNILNTPDVRSTAPGHVP